MQASVHEAKTNLSKLLAAMQRGERVIITRHGVPTAELVPARPSKIRIGSLAGIVAPPPDEFYEPMTEEELRDREGV
jgi:prevent-host-death family protein